MNQIIFLEGGGNIINGELEFIDKLAISESINNSILIMDLTTNDDEDINKYKIFLKQYFKNLGINKIYFVSEIKNLNNFKKIINEVGLIYLPGGDTELLLKSIKKKCYDKFIKNYKGVIIGNSAGALILCDKTIITKDNKIKKTKILRGLGLLNFSLEVHYNRSQDEALSKLVDIKQIYLIPEKCALICSDKEKKIIGNVSILRR